MSAYYNRIPNVHFHYLPALKMWQVSCSRSGVMYFINLHLDGGRQKHTPAQRFETALNSLTKDMDLVGALSLTPEEAETFWRDLGRPL